MPKYGCKYAKENHSNIQKYAKYFTWESFGKFCDFYIVIYVKKFVSKNAIF